MNVDCKYIVALFHTPSVTRFEVERNPSPDVSVLVKCFKFADVKLVVLAASGELRPQVTGVRVLSGGGLERTAKGRRNSISRARLSKRVKNIMYATLYYYNLY